jgi:hypothetical protein
MYELILVSIYISTKRIASRWFKVSSIFCKTLILVLENKMKQTLAASLASKCPFLLGFILGGFLLGWVMINDEPDHLVTARR